MDMKKQKHFEESWLFFKTKIKKKQQYKNLNCLFRGQFNTRYCKTISSVCIHQPSVVILNRWQVGQVYSLIYA